MLEIDQYYPMSCALTNAMPDEINKVFYESINNMPVNLEIQSLMSNWVYNSACKSVNYNNVVNLNNFIWYILSIGGTTRSAKELRNEYFSLKRRRMKHLYSIIREEAGEKKISPRNPLYMKLSCDIYFELRKTNPSLISANFATREEYLTNLYQNITQWYKNTDSYLFKFPFYNKLSAKRQANILLYDIGCYSYQYICDNYHSNIIDGYVNKVPGNVVNNPVFSGISTSLPVEYSLQGNTIDLIHRYQAKEEDGTILQTETLVKSLPSAMNIVNDMDGQLSLFEGINQQLPISDIRNLDATDYHLLVDIYSRFTMEIVNDGELIIPLRDIVKSLYPELRDSSYKKTLERLLKLSTYKITCNRVDSTGVVIGGISLSFFDMTYGVYQKEQDSDKKITMLKIPDACDSASDLLDNLLKSNDKNSIVINIMPSHYLKKQWKSGLDVAILTNMSNRIPSHKTQLISYYLQSKRTEIYPDNNIFIPHTTLRSNLMMYEARKSQYMDYIEDSLNKLQMSNVIVKEYSIGADGVSLTFFPLSEEEETYYRTFAPDILLQKSLGIQNKTTIE